MKFKEFIKGIQEFAKANPETLDTNAVCVN